jgi:hypothetical protein
MPEVLVVILIIATLCAVSIPAYFSVIEKAKCIDLGLDYPSEPSCGVIIQQPAHGSTVPQVSSFKGTFKKVPPDSVSWIYVHPSINQKYYYFEIGPLDKIPKKGFDDRSWSINKVYVGDSTDHAKDFEIGTLTTQGNITEELRKPFDFNEGNSRDILLEGQRGPRIKVYRE